MANRKKKYNHIKEVKAIARERIGQVPSTKVIRPKTKKKTRVKRSDDDFDLWLGGM